MEPCRCPHCGFDVPEWTALSERFGIKDRGLDEQLATVAQLRGQIKALKEERQNAVEVDPLYPAACEVFEYWKEKLMPRAREFNGGRLEHVMARLHAGASVEELKRAVDGAAAKPYVTNAGRSAQGTKAQWYADLGAHICKNEANMLRFQGYAPDQPAENGAEPAPAATDGDLERLRKVEAWLETAKEQLADSRKLVEYWQSQYEVVRDIVAAQHPDPSIAWLDEITKLRAVDVAEVV